MRLAPIPFVPEPRVTRHGRLMAPAGEVVRVARSGRGRGSPDAVAAGEVMWSCVSGHDPPQCRSLCRVANRCPVAFGPGASDTGDGTADRVLVVLGANWAVLLFHGTCAIHGFLDVEGAGRRAPTRQPGWWRVGSPCDVASVANASLSDFVDMYGQPCPARGDRRGKGQPALRRCGCCVGCPGRGSPLAVQHPVEDLLGEVLIYTLGSRYCLRDVRPHAFQCRLRVLVARDGARGR